MFYHVILRKFLNHSRSDENVLMDWYFRSLSKALTMLNRDFGAEAECWQIEDVTGKTPDIMSLEKALLRALESGYQYIIMTLKDGVPALKDYDHYEFLVSMKNEAASPPTFSFTDEEEASITSSTNESEGFVNLCKHQIDVKRIESVIPVYVNERNLFCGMVLRLKDGNDFILFAGKDQKEKQVNLLVNAIDADMVEGHVIPSTRTPFRGLCVRLFSGDSLYLTIGKPIPQKYSKRGDEYNPVQ